MESRMSMGVLEDEALFDIAADASPKKKDAQDKFDDILKKVNSLKVDDPEDSFTEEDQAIIIKLSIMDKARYKQILESQIYLEKMTQLLGNENPMSYDKDEAICYLQALNNKFNKVVANKSIKEARQDLKSSLIENDESTSELEFKVMQKAIEEELFTLRNEQDSILKDNSLGQYEKRQRKKKDVPQEPIEEDEAAKEMFKAIANLKLDLSEAELNVEDKMKTIFSPTEHNRMVTRKGSANDVMIQNDLKKAIQAVTSRD